MTKAWSIDDMMRDPPALLAFLRGTDTTSACLSFVAEEAGKLIGLKIIQEALCALLEHPSAVVREGAIYGLANHPEPDRLVDLLTVTATADPSPGVREAARELLSGIIGG